MAVRFDLAGRVALVTGASGALGGHFARALAEHGAAVVLAARRLDRLAERAAALTAAGLKALAVPLDVTRADSIARALDQAAAHFGRPVDVLVNNSGVAVHKPIFDHAEADWAAVMDVNLKGAWMLSLECARRLAAAKRRGAIVNIASILGVTRNSSMVHEYAASKAALAQLTRSMAVELARHDIRVNALAPGYLATEINDAFLASEAGEALRKRIPQRRFGSAADLEAALLLLASDAGAYITGTVLVVDGGLSVASI
jgi:NAD(P)-dependent dehydrogenase (short-subunit alcohol dehydrogenase family)